MNDTLESHPRSTDAQSPTQQSPEFDEAALLLFRIRFISELEPDEQRLCMQVCEKTIKLHHLLREVQQSYRDQSARLVAEVALRKDIEERISTSMDIQRFTTAFLSSLQELAILFDSSSGGDGFRDFMASRFTRRLFQDLFERQLDAESSLIACKISICFRTSSNRIVDDYVAIADYMSRVNTFFDGDFRKYAQHILTPKPADEDVVELRVKVCAMCFHGVRSVGRLFAHAQYIRRRLEAFERIFLNTWLAWPREEVNRVSFPLAVVRDALHNTRLSAMIIIALAMRFVHDDDQFVSYCRAQEDRVAREADILYELQDRIDNFIMLLRKFTSDFSSEKMTNNSSSFKTDPIDVRMIDVRVREGYNIFLAHDGTNDCIEFAISLQSEIQEHSFICYMEGIDYKFGGDVMSDQTEKALEDASVGVFLLTPEFAARKSKVAQLGHMIRRVRNARVGWPGPTIVPVFFMVSIADCRNGTIFEEGYEAGDDEKEAAKQAFHDATWFTGIENHAGANVSENEEGDERCKGLVGRTADAVAEVRITAIKEYKEQIQQTTSDKETSEQKEQHKRLSELVSTFRRSQREAREKAILDGECDTQTVYSTSTRLW